ncbi:motility associated factor glycosyltransferase family protein [Wukongibacter sp. M2B1]|uniref:motility associated factor glycosyltransferase family protein n=1 Tax=Wukongibacter sp. M2B1 TaxID=3088895 RepID=UPI003D7AAA0F
MTYESNMKAIKLKYCDIYKAIQEVKLDKKKYGVVKTKIGTPTLKIKEKDRFFFLHSKYDPLKEAKSFAKGNIDISKKNYIVYGAGFFYHITEFLEQHKDANLYLFETNKYILKTAIENINIVEIIQNPKIYIIFEEDIYRLLMKFHEVLGLNNKKLIIHMPSLNTIPKGLEEFKYILEDHIMKENTIRKFSDLLDENFLFNINRFDFNVDILFNKFKNLPAIIVSAGPSLDKNREALKFAKDKALILCVGRAVKSLVEIGIRPDAIIITDPQDFVYSSQLKGLNIDIPIIILSTCDKKVSRNYRGIKFIALQRGYSPSEIYAENNNHHLVETGGSVATAALDTVIKFGCNPIVFVGQDLAYTDWKTHADSAVSNKVIKNKELRIVKDINGDIVYTSKSFHMFLKWFENRIRREKKITFIDATEGGARIEGTEIMTLKDVIDNILINHKRPFNKIFEEVKNEIGKFE